MIELLSYTFMQKALISGIMIGIACSLLGTFLVLARLSLLGDGLAHVAFGGIAIGILFGVNPIAAALVTAALGAVFVQRIVTSTRLYGDSATALILSMGVGVAVLIIGAAKGFTVDLFSYLFGSILAISSLDILIISIVLLAVVIFIILFYKKLVLISFNQELARISGVSIGLVTTLFAILTAMTVVISIRAVGILLVSSLIVIPSMTALLISRSFKMTLLLSMLFSVFSIITGIILSFYLDLPPGGTIVVLMCLLFIGVLGTLRIKDWLRKSR